MTKVRATLTCCLLTLCSLLGGHEIIAHSAATAANVTSTALQATYSIDNSWPTGYQVLVTITNKSSSPTTTWQATFTLPSGESLGANWNGVFSTSNQTVTVKNPAWAGGGVIKPGASTTFGMIVNMPASGTIAINNLQATANGTPIPTPVPAAPVLNAITASSNNYILSWNSVTNATSYVLQQDVTSNFTNPSIVFQGAALSKSFSNVANGTYYYRVLANNQAGNSSYSNIQKVVINVQPSPVPAAPVLNAITASSNNYTVSWNSVKNATSYLLQQDVTSSFTSPSTVFEGAALSQSFSNIANGTYYYRVLASNQTGNSSYSNIQNVVINVQPSPVPAPTLSSINNPSDAGQYTVSWSAVANATGYTLQESTTSGFQTATTIFQGNATSYQVTGRSAGTYYYRISATAGNVTSSWSNVVNTVVGSTPPTTGAIVEGYWESWDSTASIPTIVGMQCDVFDISFMTFTSSGNHTFTLSGLDTDLATMDQFVAAVHSAGKLVKLSVGGASYGLQSLLQTTADASGMAQALATFVQQHDLDGLDFDIEDRPAANLIIALLQDVRQLLPNAIISYTAESPASTTAPYDQVIPAAYTYFDYINIMAYDYGSGYTYQEDVQALLAMGIPAGKIGIGLMPGKDDVGVTTTKANIVTAANYVMANGLKGIMFWDLNRDLENSTGLGVDVATSTAWSIIH